MRAAHGFTDVISLRALTVAAAALILWGTYRIPAVRAQAREVLVGYLAYLVVWMGVLLTLNRLSSESALGFVFVYAAVAAVLSFVVDRPGSLALMLTVGVGVGVGASLAAPDPETSPLALAFSVASLGIILYTQSRARIAERENHDETERTLAEAERMGQTGSWTHHLTTGYRWWSAGMYRIVGAEPREGEPPLVLDYVSMGEIAPLRSDDAALKAGHIDESDRTVTILREDGEARTVRSMVRLHRQDGQPHRLVGVVLDVTQQRETERVLDDARREAEAAAALKSSILANMSHEIRTPLTAVIGFARLLRDELEGAHDDLLEPIEMGGERLLATLNSVLDFAQFEAGEVTLETAPLDLTAEARSIAALFGPRAEEAGLAFSVDAPAAPVYALASRGAASRALTNLVSNAIKFTREGAVSVRVREASGAAEVSVTDTGQGIAEEFLPDLFEPFRQESSGNARRHEGSGLGLAITQRLVLAMDGSISVDSVPGEGTTFTVRLPLAEPPATPEAPATPLAGAREAALPGTAWIARGDGATDAPPSLSPTAPERAGA